MSVTEVVPFLRVTDMERSVRYYVDGLGFTMAKKWIDGGKLRWCWLTKDSAALMLQEFWNDGHHSGRPEGNLGQGVGNAMWNFSLSGPDGYRIEFERPTDTPEETKLSHVTR